MTLGISERYQHDACVYRKLHGVIMDAAREAQVPFWRQEQIYRDVCSAYQDGLALVRSKQKFTVSPETFVHAARKATSIPIVRANGSSYKQVLALANEMCIGTTLLMTLVGDIPYACSETAFVFGSDMGAAISS